MKIRFSQYCQKFIRLFCGAACELITFLALSEFSAVAITINSAFIPSGTQVSDILPSSGMILPLVMLLLSTLRVVAI